MGKDIDRISELHTRGKKECKAEAEKLVPEIEKLKQYRDLIPGLFAQLESDVRKRRTKPAIERLRKVRRSYTAIMEAFIAHKENERLMHLSLGNVHETLNPYVDKEEYPSMV